LKLIFESLNQVIITMLGIFCPHWACSCHSWLCWL